ncbi:MAG: DUF3306 domain-containing protein [Variovorax sp.]|nr:MAG: DUF3306 domain-containing protein [Variovorax sp.]
MSEGGFLGRWSRRKLEVKEQQEKAPLPTPEATALPLESPHPGLPREAEAELPPLTLADAEALTIDSDFKPFLAKAVAPEVKNAAFKKLFADPHFNVMDRLDIYIDDYSNPAPLPDSTLRQMASAKFMKLFEDEEPETPPEDNSPLSPPVAAADAAPPASQENDAHSNADLRLQPDDAARAEDARRGAG